MWGLVKRLLERPKPRLFEPADKVLDEVVRTQAERLGLTAEQYRQYRARHAPSAYWNSVDRRAQESERVPDEVVRQDLERLARKVEGARPTKACLDPREVEDFVLHRGLPPEREAHWRECILCQALTAAARPPDAARAKAFADALAEADHLDRQAAQDWLSTARRTSQREEPIRRPVPVPVLQAKAAALAPTPAVSRPARAGRRPVAAPAPAFASSVQPARSRDLIAALVGCVLLAVGIYAVKPAATPPLTNGKLDDRPAISDADMKQTFGLVSKDLRSPLSSDQLHSVLSAQADQDSKAVADYNRLLHADALKSQAVLNAKAGRWESALQDCDRLLELKPTDSVGYLLRGQANTELGRTEEAKRDYQKAVEVADRKNHPALELTMPAAGSKGVNTPP